MHFRNAHVNVRPSERETSGPERSAADSRLPLAGREARQRVNVVSFMRGTRRSADMEHALLFRARARNNTSALRTHERYAARRHCPSPSSLPSPSPSSLPSPSPCRCDVITEIVCSRGEGERVQWSATVRWNRRAKLPVSDDDLENAGSRPS